MDTIKQIQINKIDIVKVKPKFIAQSCVVCNTWGTLRHGTIVCQACGGSCL